MNLLTSGNDLYSYRVDEIKDLIKRLSNNKNLFVNSFSIKRNAIFTVSDVPQRYPSEDYTDHRFQTISELVNASYLEVWVPLDPSNSEYFLKTSNLHFYCQIPEYLDNRPNGELLLVHTDPNIAVNEHHAIYKQRTHLHLQPMPYNLNHSQLAINLGIDNLYESRDNFNKSLERSFLMIKEQVLELIKYN